MHFPKYYVTCLIKVKKVIMVVEDDCLTVVVVYKNDVGSCAGNYFYY